MALDYGNTPSFRVYMAGPFGLAGGTEVKITDVSLPVEGWKGATSPYSQIVTVSGVSMNSRIDLQPNPIQMDSLKGIALIAANDAGRVTVFAVGGKPGSSMSVQATITEVIA